MIVRGESCLKVLRLSSQPPTNFLLNRTNRNNPKINLLKGQNAFCPPHKNNTQVFLKTFANYSIYELKAHNINNLGQRSRHASPHKKRPERAPPPERYIKQLNSITNHCHPPRSNDSHNKLQYQTPTMDFESQQTKRVYNSN